MVVRGTSVLREERLEVGCRIAPLWEREAKDCTGHAVKLLTKDMTLSVKEVIGLRHDDGCHWNARLPLLRDEGFEGGQGTKLVDGSGHQIERSPVFRTEVAKVVGATVGEVESERQSDSYSVGALGLIRCVTQTDRGTKGEAPQDSGTVAQLEASPLAECLPGGCNVCHLRLSVTVTSFGTSGATKVESKSRKTLITECFIEGMNDLVGHRSTVEWVGMAGNETTEWVQRLHCDGLKCETVGGN